MYSGVVYTMHLEIWFNIQNQKVSLITEILGVVYTMYLEYWFNIQNQKVPLITEILGGFESWHQYPYAVAIMNTKTGSMFNIAEANVAKCVSALQSKNSQI